jgi:tripartite-type tricarboxylate transporter receptor subunit TctC
MNRRRLLELAGVAGAAALAVLLPRHGLAQTYPARPVRVIVPFAPGGFVDVTTRLVAGKLGEQIGKQFYIENIVGGSGNIGMGQAARAAPDGYTMLAAFSSLVINPTLFNRLHYDPLKDFDPVSLAVTSTTVIVVNMSLVASTVGELVALIRANPGKFTYSSAGTGTTSHLAGEQFRLAFGLDLVHVPFTGGAPAMAAVVAGHTPVGFNAPTAAVPLVRDGKLRALAVTSKSRIPTLPEIATLTEGGYPEIEGDSFVGFVVPAGTPRDIVALLNREIAKTMATADMRERQEMLGNEPMGSTPEEFGKRIKAELATWAKVIRVAGIKAG